MSDLTRLVWHVSFDAEVWEDFIQKSHDPKGMATIVAVFAPDLTPDEREAFAYKSTDPAATLRYLLQGQGQGPGLPKSVKDRFDYVLMNMGGDR